MRRYGGKTAEERIAERRAQLLDAGLELFGTVGLAGATIEALCASAGLHPRYFYEQFSGKEELLGAVYSRAAETILGQVLVAIGPSGGGEVRARLKAGLSAFIEASLADPRVARITYFEMSGAGPEVEGRRRTVLRQYAELIAAELEASGASVLPAGVDPRLAAMALVSATDGLIVDSLTADPPRELADVVRTLVALFAPDGR